MCTFQEIVDNGLTSREEVEMEYNAKEGAFQRLLALSMSDIATALTAPQLYTLGIVSARTVDDDDDGR